MTLKLFLCKYQDCYYPTMPQDELLEIKEALLAARKHNGNENPVFYSELIILFYFSIFILFVFQ